VAHSKKITCFGNQTSSMHPSFVQVSLFLLLGISVIIVLTARFGIPAFFALLLACFVVGLGIEMPVADIIATSKDGFGNIMKSLGFIIVLGTTLGGLLEYSGSTRTMAGFILKKTGEKRAALAMSITGFIVGLPIFCDSGYIVLSGLNQSMAKKTGISMIVMSVSLATGLLSVHCLVPPHPGAAAAAISLGVDFGRLLLFGVIVAIPAMLLSHSWAVYAGKKMPATESFPTEKNETTASQDPPVWKAFLPVLVPILLIAVKSFQSIEKAEPSVLHQIFSTVGDPVIALSIGILLSLNAGSGWTRQSIATILQEAAEKAGGILVIIAAGGAFGAILAASKIGQHFSQVIALGSMGLLFPFLLCFILKTAQGSSTVAIITAAAIVQPLLPALEMDSSNGRLLTVLAMGAGSMMISHANDAYFWVISKFSGLEMKPMLKVYSIASIIMGLSSLLMVYIISLFLK
jgi:gluconate:H+ symporter, GntP family